MVRTTGTPGPSTLLGVHRAPGSTGHIAVEHGSGEYQERLKTCTSGRLGNYTLLTSGMAIPKSNVYGLSNLPGSERFSNAVVKWRDALTIRRFPIMCSAICVRGFQSLCALREWSPPGPLYFLGSAFLETDIAVLPYPGRRRPI